MARVENDEQATVVALGENLKAAREVIEVLIRRYERSQGPLATDQFAVRKAMASLEDSLAASTRALRLSESRYRMLFDHSPHMICTVDAEGKILSCNRTMAGGLRCRPKELTGRPLAELFDESSARFVQEMILQEFDSLLERGLSLSDGRKVALTAAPLPGFHRETQVSMHDVTARQLLEEELQHTRRLAAIGQLASGVAHEINNPLAVMQGRLEMLLQSSLTDPEVLRRRLSQVAEHSQRVERIVQNLQTFARPAPAVLAPVGLAELMDAVGEAAEPQLGRVVLHADVTPPRLAVLADGEQLRYALVNLLINAADAMRRRGRIDINARKVARAESELDLEAVEIAVRDDGPAVRPELLEDLLSPFEGETLGGRRAGLGLAIAQGIVHEHGGIMRATNRKAGGACITICLPAIESSPSSGPAGAVELGRRVLVVDADPFLRETVEQHLDTSSYDPHFARDGEEALRRLGAAEYDAVLVSIRLPGMSGLELRHAIAGRNPMLAARTVVMGSFIGKRPADILVLQRPFSRLQLLRALERATREA